MEPITPTHSLTYTIKCKNKTTFSPSLHPMHHELCFKLIDDNGKSHKLKSDEKWVFDADSKIDQNVFFKTLYSTTISDAVEDRFKIVLQEKFLYASGEKSNVQRHNKKAVKNRFRELVKIIKDMHSSDKTDLPLLGKYTAAAQDLIEKQLCNSILSGVELLILAHKSGMNIVNNYECKGMQLFSSTIGQTIGNYNLAWTHLYHTENQFMLSKYIGEGTGTLKNCSDLYDLLVESKYPFFGKIGTFKLGLTDSGAAPYGLNQDLYRIIAALALEHLMKASYYPPKVKDIHL